MEVISLDRDEYLNSIKKITHYESLKFAKQALDWWDNYYSWSKFPCLVLTKNNQHISYLFFTISKNSEYLTIHNILTPKEFRGNGYAFNLLDELFCEFTNKTVERFKMFCVSSSISFYNRVGLNYWGVNTLGQYYSDFEMPSHSILEIPKIIKNTKIDDLKESKVKYIYDKVKSNGKEFEELEVLKHLEVMELMDKKYLFDELFIKIKRMKYGEI